MAQWYYGNASYFDSCPIGHDCCDNYYDIAYGYYWTDQACQVLPQRGCYDNVTVFDQCTQNQYYAHLSTQCSCSSELGSCNGNTMCNGNWDSGTTTPILDLTDDLFLYLHGNLTDGRVKFAVYT